MHIKYILRVLKARNSIIFFLLQKQIIKVRPMYVFLRALRLALPLLLKEIIQERRVEHLNL